MAKEQHKTNAMRTLDATGARYEARFFDCPEALSGVEVARRLGIDEDRVFKTLVTQGRSGAHYVFMIPAGCELDLKKAARAVGEKAIELVHVNELLGLTGYVRGGCSPVGMKKQFPTVFHEMAEIIPTILVSAGKIGWQIECAPADLIALVGASTADLVKD